MLPYRKLKRLSVLISIMMNSLNMSKMNMRMMKKKRRRMTTRKMKMAKGGK